MCDPVLVKMENTFVSLGYPLSDENPDTPSDFLPKHKRQRYDAVQLQGRDRS